MSNVNCCVDGCYGRKCKNPNLSFHKFPLYLSDKQEITKKLNRNRAWIQALKLRKDISKSSTVCSLHFRKEDFILPDCPSQKPRLKNTAVPHLDNQNSWVKRSNVYRGPGKKNLINKEVRGSTSKKRLRMKNVSKQMDEFNTSLKTKSFLRFPEYSGKISIDGSEGTDNKLKRIYVNEPEVKDFEKDNKFEVLYLTPVKFECSRYSDEETSSSNSEMGNKETNQLSSDSEHENNEEVPLVDRQICRICLKTRNLTSLIKLHSLVDLFINITSIKVEKGDNLPKYMCSDCIKKLDGISKFINMARKNDEDLKQSLVANDETKIKNSVDVHEKISITKRGNSNISEKAIVIDDTMDTSKSPESQPSERKQNTKIVKKNEDIYRNCICWKCGVLHVGVKFPKNLSDVPLHKIKFQCRKCALFRSSPNQKPSDTKESFSPTVFPDLELNNDDRKLRCATCSTDFPLSEYAEHQAKEHKMKKRFRCLKCLSAFSHPNLLVQHSIKHK